eukprot:TRINITY_DN12571_c0_g2_i2.p1 TRINITY_DN12571_c0_g2~~TRINITY_DN12571_c0_g2_i2.p1  ORF type:complete len:109 (+),score=6.43 TRINITY_DN12571_c0_g2_i2:363-689(+)
MLIAWMVGKLQATICASGTLQRAANASSNTFPLRFLPCSAQIFFAEHSGNVDHPVKVNGPDIWFRGYLVLNAILSHLGQREMKSASAAVLTGWPGTLRALRRLCKLIP